MRNLLTTLKDGCFRCVNGPKLQVEKEKDSEEEDYPQNCKEKETTVTNSNAKSPPEQKQDISEAVQSGKAPPVSIASRFSLCPKAAGCEEAKGDTSTRSTGTEQSLSSQVALPQEASDKTSADPSKDAAISVQPLSSSSCCAVPNTISSEEKSSSPDSSFRTKEADGDYEILLNTPTSCLEVKENTDSTTHVGEADPESTEIEENLEVEQPQSSKVQPDKENNMATQAIPPAADVSLPAPLIEPVAAENISSPPGDASPVLEKVAETPSAAAAESRLSASESPEPEEVAAETAKAESGETAEKSSERVTNGAAAGSSSKAESESKMAKTKKKEDKSIEYILRALSSLNSPEEKLAALCKKYADLHEESRVLQSSFKQQQRKMTVVQREKDQLQAEHTKAIIAKSKLESLCRELQKHNKVVKEESLLRAKEEEERRKELCNKFQTAMTDIQTQMTEYHETNSRLQREKQELATQLKDFLKQYELKEEHMAKVTKHSELEQQLAEAKLQQSAAILQEEKERNLKEKELILLKSTESEKKNAVLEAQLTMYKDRYEEFQATINKSNDMFQKLKSEMDKMGKRIKKLEKEGAAWRAKWETSNKTVLELAEEKSRSDKEKQTMKTKISKLESLCRALQGELHGKKSPSPQPDTAEADSSRTAVSSTSGDATTTTAATSDPSPTTTATPPNTPENASRASPSPDSTSQPAPPGQNGPVGAPTPSPDPAPQGEQATEGEGQVSSSSDVVAKGLPAAPESSSQASAEASESPSSSTCPAPAVEAEAV